MSEIKYVVLKSTGEFEQGGFFEPNINIPDPSNPPNGTKPDPLREVVVLDRHPDLRLDRWDGAKITLKTTAQLNAWDSKDGGKLFDAILASDSFLEALVEELGVNLTTLKTKFKAKIKAKK